MIVTRAEGNAFFTEELVGAAMVGKQIPPGRSRRPPARPARSARRHQPPGRSSDVGRRSSGQPRPADRVVEVDPTPLDAALRVAVERNVLVPVGDDGYAFRHALLAEAVYDDLLPGERVRLHRTYTAVLRDERRARARRPRSPGTRWLPMTSAPPSRQASRPATKPCRSAGPTKPPSTTRSRSSCSPTQPPTSPRKPARSTSSA